jgi:hypothetical protein
MHSLSKTTAIYAMLMISLLFAAPLSAQDKVRVGLSSVSATNGSIWVAEDKGLFRKLASMMKVMSNSETCPRTRNYHRRGAEKASNLLKFKEQFKHLLWQETG